MRKSLIITLCAVCLGLAAPAAAQDCYADYKAKQNDPLRLHYGVSQISGSCTKANASTQISSRISQDGWVLLNVLSVFDASGLEGKKADAGAYYLRY